MMMDTLLRDIRYGMRTLVKRPVFTVVAVLVLGLGIGANTAIFSVVNAILLRSLPFRDADQLVLLWGSRPAQGRLPVPLSLPNFNDVKAQTQGFEAMSAWTLGRFNVTDPENAAEPEQVQYAIVSSNFFSVLGVSPSLGRTFLPEEEKSGRSRAVMISGALWARRFGSDHNVIGKPIT